MRYFVSRIQSKAWRHPLVEQVVNAAMLGTETELQKELKTVVFDSGLWTPFLPIPFTADSQLGQRISEALVQLKAEFPQRATVAEFDFRFWRPHSDALDSMLVDDAIEIDAQRRGVQVTTTTLVEVFN